MKSIALKAYKVSNIELKNKLPGATKLELKNQYSHNVKYGKNNTCEGILTVKVTDKNQNENFGITATVQGIFRYEGELVREKVHVETFNALFPYARALVSNLTASSGMPPIIIPPIDIENQEIYHIEMNPNNFDKE